MSIDRPKSEIEFQETDDNDINRWFTHFSKADLPVEDEIVNIWFDKSVLFTGDWYKLLHSLYLITGKGYYIKVKEIIPDESKYYHYGKTDIHEMDDYGLFLDGIIRMIFGMSFHWGGDIKSALKLILTQLKRYTIYMNKIVRGPNIGQYIFRYLPAGYTIIR